MLTSLAAATFNMSVALGCGALIGMERQMRQRKAGLRTNALVALGAAAFVLRLNRLVHRHHAVAGIGADDRNIVVFQERARREHDVGMAREENRIHAGRPRGRSADVLELVHDGTIDMEAVFAQAFREFHFDAV